MTKTPNLTPIVTSNQASGTTNNERAQTPNPPSSTDALKRQLSNAPGAAIPFSNNKAAEPFPDEEEVAYPSDSNDSGDGIDINRSQSFLSVNRDVKSPSPFDWILGFGRSRSAEPRMSTFSLHSSQDHSTTTQRRRSRSPSVSTPSKKRRDAAEQTFAFSSPHHRMNATKVWPDFQRDHFLLHAEKKGYGLAASEKRLPPNTQENTNAPGVIRDNELYAEWQALKGRKINPHEFFRHRSNQTKEERIAFALNLARLLASRSSAELGPVLSHSLNTELQKLHAYDKTLSQPATPQSAPVPTTDHMRPSDMTLTGQNTDANGVASGFPDFEAVGFNAQRPASSRLSLREKPRISANIDIKGNNDRLEAERIDSKDFCDVKLLELYDDPIDEAKETLRNLLKPSTDDNDHLGGAERVNWSPCSNDREVEDVLRLFDEMCASNNALVHARIDEIHDKRVTMRNGALPRLGMPVELRGGILADSIRAEAATDFSKAKGWHTENTFKNVAKDVWAIVGTVIGGFIPLAFKGWRDFISSRYSSSYRNEQIEGHADLQQINQLKEKNRELAKQWVTETFTGYDKYGRPKSDVNNSKGLTDHYESWNVNDNDLVEEVMQQLELATKADILFEKEKQATQLGLPINHPDVHVPNEDYLLDQDFLREMARGVVEGVSEGLKEAGLPLDASKPKMEVLPSDQVVEFND